MSNLENQNSREGADGTSFDLAELQTEIRAGSIQEIIIQSGDSLWKLVKREYNFSKKEEIVRKIAEIVEFNKKFNQNADLKRRIQIDSLKVVNGQTLRGQDGIGGDQLRKGDILLFPKKDFSALPTPPEPTQMIEHSPTSSAPTLSESNGNGQTITVVREPEISEQQRQLEQQRNSLIQAQKTQFETTKNFIGDFIKQFDVLKTEFQNISKETDLSKKRELLEDFKKKYINSNFIFEYGANIDKLKNIKIVLNSVGFPDLDGEIDGIVSNSNTIKTDFESIKNQIGQIEADLKQKELEQQRQLEQQRLDIEKLRLRNEKILEIKNYLLSLNLNKNNLHYNDSIPIIELKYNGSEFKIEINEDFSLKISCKIGESRVEIYNGIYSTKENVWDIIYNFEQDLGIREYEKSGLQRYLSNLNTFLLNNNISQGNLENFKIDGINISSPQISITDNNGFFNIKYTNISGPHYYIITDKNGNSKNLGTEFDENAKQTIYEFIKGQKLPETIDQKNKKLTNLENSITNSYNQNRSIGELEISKKLVEQNNPIGQGEIEIKYKGIDGANFKISVAQDGNIKILCKEVELSNGLKMINFDSEDLNLGNQVISEIYTYIQFSQINLEKNEKLSKISDELKKLEENGISGITQNLFEIGKNINLNPTITFEYNQILYSIYLDFNNNVNLINLGNFTIENLGKIDDFEKIVENLLKKLGIMQQGILVEQPAPVVEQPKPAVEQPAPVVEQPKPAVEQQEPVIDQQEPAVEQPEPAVEQPEPAVEQPESVIDQQEPAVEQPEPVVEQPEPVVDQTGVEKIPTNEYIIEKLTNGIIDTPIKYEDIEKKFNENENLKKYIQKGDLELGTYFFGYDIKYWKSALKLFKKYLGFDELKIFKNLDNQYLKIDGEGDKKTINFNLSINYTDRIGKMEPRISINLKDILKDGKIDIDLFLNQLSIKIGELIKTLNEQGKLGKFGVLMTVEEMSNHIQTLQAPTSEQTTQIPTPINSQDSTSVQTTIETQGNNDNYINSLNNIFNNSPIKFGDIRKLFDKDGVLNTGYGKYLNIGDYERGIHVFSERQWYSAFDLWTGKFMTNSISKDDYNIRFNKNYLQLSDGTNILVPFKIEGNKLIINFNYIPNAIIDDKDFEIEIRDILDGNGNISRDKLLLKIGENVGKIIQENKKSLGENGELIENPNKQTGNGDLQVQSGETQNNIGDIIPSNQADFLEQKEIFEQKLYDFYRGKMISIGEIKNNFIGEDKSGLNIALKVWREKLSSYEFSDTTQIRRNGGWTDIIEKMEISKSGEEYYLNIYFNYFSSLGLTEPFKIKLSNILNDGKKIIDFNKNSNIEDFIDRAKLIQQIGQQISTQFSGQQIHLNTNGDRTNPETQSGIIDTTRIQSFPETFDEFGIKIKDIKEKIDEYYKNNGIEINSVFSGKQWISLVDVFFENLSGPQKNDEEKINIYGNNDEITGFEYFEKDGSTYLRLRLDYSRQSKFNKLPIEIKLQDVLKDGQFDKSKMIEQISKAISSILSVNKENIKRKYGEIISKP